MNTKSNVIPFPLKPAVKWDFPVMKRRTCVDGMRQFWDDGFEWEPCHVCDGQGCE